MPDSRIKNTSIESIQNSMAKIFVDTDVCLDLLSGRKPFNAFAEKLFTLADLVKLKFVFLLFHFHTSITFYSHHIKEQIPERFWLRLKPWSLYWHWTIKSLSWLLYLITLILRMPFSTIRLLKTTLRYS